jgi:hypothetical protein
MLTGPFFGVQPVLAVAPHAGAQVVVPAVVQRSALLTRRSGCRELLELVEAVDHAGADADHVHRDLLDAPVARAALVPGPARSP